MLKHVLLAGGMMIAAPAMAQVAPAGQETPAMQPQTAPDASAAPVTSGQQAPMQQAPAPTTAAPDKSAQSATAPADPNAPAPAQSADTQPAPAQSGNSGSAVAQVVDQGWSTYDKNGDGKLSEAEFGAWMVALKKQTDPATRATSPATRQYVAGAFAQADKDKSRSISRKELEGFLGGQG